MRHDIPATPRVVRYSTWFFVTRTVDLGFASISPFDARCGLLAACSAKTSSHCCWTTRCPSPRSPGSSANHRGTSRPICCICSRVSNIPNTSRSSSRPAAASAVSSSMPPSWPNLRSALVAGAPGFWNHACRCGRNRRESVIQWLGPNPKVGRDGALRRPRAQAARNERRRCQDRRTIRSAR